jgi:hypothetical protein
MEMFMRKTGRRGWGIQLAAVVATLLISLAAAPTTATAASCLPSSIKSTLKNIERKFGPVSIVSAHRPGARISGSGRPSLHASCRAVDFHPPKGKYKQVLSYLKSNHNGGLGTYSCGMYHLHIDNGPYVRFHKCQSASLSGKAKSATKLAKANTAKSTKFAKVTGRKPKLVSVVGYAMLQ